MDKPRIFLGSSGKQEKLLQALTRGLEPVAQVDPWTTSFQPGTTTLERLFELAHQVDFAAFAFARKITYEPHLIDAHSGVGTQIVARDANGDGKADVIVGNKRGTILFLSK